jgi:hypothetical protein
MKRPPQRKAGVRSSNPFDNLSVPQLAYIGAIAMLYNDLEVRIDDMISTGLHLPFSPVQVLSRINGMDGKLALVKLSAKHYGFDEAEMSDLCQTLGANGFERLKEWRDAVIHARMFDVASGVAHTHARKGKHYEVLLSKPALEALYKRMDAMRSELGELHAILRRKGRLTRGASDDQHKERLESENRASWTRYQEHLRRRLSLPPMPEFPPDTLDTRPMAAGLAHGPKPRP